ncbi:MAG: hypothetical protein NTU41_03160, partial [Chloroflexi bacterium]|nr:hypothetical protein [Chloroflexota bacterium]
MGTSFQTEPWVILLGADPRPWLLDAGEPAARWIALTELLGRPEDDSEAREARGKVVTDAGTASLIERLQDWEAETAMSGHNSPSFAPNMLNLLADSGLQAGDHPAIERVLDQMLRQQDRDGRFCTLGRWRGQPLPKWGSLLCDTHAITEVLVRFGRGSDGRVKVSLERMSADLTDTAQGQAWPCLPDPETGFRGPGRRTDLCPQVTLEALRLFARLPPEERPDGINDVARTSLAVWRRRGKEKPYMFGHGRQFKTVKWPPTWYDVSALLLAESRYPELRQTPEDRRTLAELAACLVAYNFNPDGKVTPRSCYQGYEAYSFGQKKQPSPWATVYLCG